MNVKVKQVVCKLTIGVFVATACFSLLANLPAAVNNVNADSGVAINEDNFPDENFRNYVLENYDTDHDEFLSESEISNVTSMDIQSMSISDLTGIEYFTDLTILNCCWNKLTSLDLHNCTALKELYCGSNIHLVNLDISDCAALTTLSCNYVDLTSLDVSNCTALTTLSCVYNELTTLDLNNNTALERLVCDYNKLTYLDVSNCTALTELHCYHKPQ